MLHFNKRPEDCTVDELKAYLVHTRDVQQLSSSSVNLRVCGLKYYFREVAHRLDLIDACDECGHLRISYNSCRNRHCPTCQGLDKEMWAIQQEEQLLPAPYFHVVFTLPHELNGLCMHNPRFMYSLLLEAGWHTLHSFGSNPKWLGARTAATVVLHTWGQNLSLHPHIHCIVPSGGLCKDGKWQLPKRGNARFLYPVTAMKKVFRAFFMQHLRSALEQGQLALPKGFPYKRGPY